MPDAAIEPDERGFAPAREATLPPDAASERAISRVIQTIALSGSDLLDGKTDGETSPGRDLPRQVDSLPYDAEQRLLTTIHELRGEREAEMFPGVGYMVLTRGAASPLLARVAHEHLAEGTAALDDQGRAGWQRDIEELERQDWRSLGIAWRPLDELPEEPAPDVVEGDNAMLALLGVREIGHLPPATERSVARRIALQVLFELDCTDHGPEKVIHFRIASQEASRKQARYVRQLVTLVRQHLGVLDETLRNYAIDWPPEQLAIVDRNILRMAILEFALTRRAPVAVVINEAVELARLFSSADSFDFINGVLGAIAAEDSEDFGAEETAPLSRARLLRDYRAAMSAPSELAALPVAGDAVALDEGMALP